MLLLAYFQEKKKRSIWTTHRPWISSVSLCVLLLKNVFNDRTTHLPHDLVLNILANLPVKSVLRFRCVRKSWNSSITSPNFISSHLELYSSRRLLFMKRDRIPHDRLLCTVICEHASDWISDFDIPFTWPQLVGSCNGLLCFSAKDSVYLLNPSIGKFKTVSLLSSSSSASFSPVQTGFCYHSETNDYKIVKISYRNWSLNMGGTPPQAEIYSMNSGSWKFVPRSIC